MSLIPSNNNNNPGQIDSATFHCNRCLTNNRTNTVKQYYVNFDTTISMCSVCKGQYLLENEVIVHNSVQKSVSDKSLKKLSLLPFLLKEVPDETFTQEQAKQILKTAYQSYKRSLAHEETKLNDFFALVNQLLPNHVKNHAAQNSRALVNVEPVLPEESQDLDCEDVFYFSNGLTLSKSEITDDDIEAAISALTSGNSPEVNYDDLPDIDSLLEYSAKLEQTIPILSDETLLSPIYPDRIDEALRHLNNNQEGIRVNVDFDALQKLLAAPSDKTHESSEQKTRNKKVGRYLAKTMVRPCDLVRKSFDLQQWQAKNRGKSLSKLTKSLNKMGEETKRSIENSLNSRSETVPSSSLNSTCGKTSNNKCVYSYNKQNCEQNYEFSSDSGYCVENRKMFKGFEFAHFIGEALRTQPQTRSKVKKRDSKAKSITVTLFERLRRQKNGSVGSSIKSVKK